MAASPAAVLAGLVMAGAGILILVLRRPGPASGATFALLALWGGATLSSAAMIGADSAAEATVPARLTVWYSLPLPALLLFAAPALVGSASLARAMRPAAWAFAALALAGAVAFAVDPRLFILAVGSFGTTYNITAGPLHYLLTAASPLVQAFVALLAFRHARSDAPDAERERARWVAMAVVLFPLHAGAFFVGYLALWPTSSLVIPQFWWRAVPTLAAGALAAYALAGERRRGLVIAGTLAAALGLLDGALGGLILRGIAIPGYESNVLLVRVAFALLLSVAALRFGLADAGAGARRAVGRATTAALAASAVALVGALAYLALGRSPVAIVVGIGLGASVPLALRAPLARAGTALGARLLLPPDDRRAVAERARAYASAVAASQGAGAEGQKLLVAMRADLGISEREHELLAQGLASREGERYRAVDVLGSGATAQVELAVDEVAGRRVVVKRFKALRDPAAALREARALAAVRHPRVVPFLEVDRRGGDLFLVLAYAEGGSARQLLEREGPLPPARAVGLALDLLDGLDALHREGIVHCDVKPENLLLDRDGRGLLGDFGSARFSAPDLVDATLAGGGAEGSLSTISPEALRGAKPEAARDVYAVGALLYRLLTGQHYVDLADVTVFEAHERIRLDAPRLPHPQVPRAIEAVLIRALAKRAAERYQSVREMRDALAAALAA